MASADYQQRLQTSFLKRTVARAQAEWSTLMQVRTMLGNRRVSVKTGVEFYQHAASVKLQTLLQSSNQQSQRGIVVDYLRNWEAFVAQDEVKKMLTVLRLCDKKLTAVYAPRLNPDHPQEQIVAIKLISKLCETFLIQITESEHGSRMYQEREKFIESYEAYICSDPPTEPLQSIDFDVQLLALCKEGVCAHNMKVIASWAHGFLKRAHIEKLVARGRNRQEVVSDYQEVPQLTQEEIMEIYTRYIGVGPAFKGIRRVIATHGKLLGFANDVNALPSASLSHRARIDNRFKPQARF